MLVGRVRGVGTGLWYVRVPGEAAVSPVGQACWRAVREQRRGALGYDTPALNRWTDVRKGTVQGRKYLDDRALRSDELADAVTHAHVERKCSERTKRVCEEGPEASAVSRFNSDTPSIAESASMTGSAPSALAFPPRPRTSPCFPPTASPFPFHPRPTLPAIC